MAGILMIIRFVQQGLTRGQTTYVCVVSIFPSITTITTIIINDIINIIAILVIGSFPH